MSMGSHVAHPPGSNSGTDARTQAAWQQGLVSQDRTWQAQVATFPVPENDRTYGVYRICKKFHYEAVALPRALQNKPTLALLMPPLKPTQRLPPPTCCRCCSSAYASSGATSTCCPCPCT